MSFHFNGNCLVYEEKRIPLSDHCFYLDGRLDETQVSQSPYVYRDLREVMEAVSAKGAKGVFTVYIAPYVYWVDDPDAVDVVDRDGGYGIPYGVTVECDSLRLVGLTKEPAQVILAGNRGQSHGARGNYTMFRFQIRDLEVENLTMGNYCSVDLEYPPDPQLDHTRRTSTITQAQLAFQEGDRMFARNCHFISRLNLMPICGGKRCLYECCHFESTDDSLNGRAVYLGCDFDFYGSRPLYDTQGSGAVFLNCLFKGRIKADRIEKVQYFTKESSPVTLVDCRYQADAGVSEKIAWTGYPRPNLKCYQYGMFYNGEPVIVGGACAAETVSMEGRKILGGYRLETKRGVVYNTYNLLRGEDDWDPLQMKETAQQAGKDRMATLLAVETSAGKLAEGEPGVILQARAYYFYGKQKEKVQAVYTVSQEDSACVKLTDQGDGRCLVEGTGAVGEERRVLIRAVTPEGLEGAVELIVQPKLFEAPVFAKKPVIRLEEKGKLKVHYELEPEGRADRSVISWYRCESRERQEAILTAVSREKEPMQTYDLNWGDVGYHLMALVEPIQAGSKAGNAVWAVFDERISGDCLSEDMQRQPERGGLELATDFHDLPTVRQERILPGCWTVDCCRPADAEGIWNQNTDLHNTEPWKYGKTGNGSEGVGFYQNIQGARLLYTPVRGVYGDVELKLTVDPAKTAGQGFGRAGQYMDVCIKFDTSSLCGYGVRIIRTTEASDGVRFVPVRYDHGSVMFLGKGVMTSCYITGCEISLWTKGNRMGIHGESKNLRAFQGEIPYASAVDLEAEIEENPFGGVAVWHAGSLGTGGWQNTSMLHTLEVKWEVKFVKTEHGKV